MNTEQKEQKIRDISSVIAEVSDDYFIICRFREGKVNRTVWQYSDSNWAAGAALDVVNNFIHANNA